MDMVQRCTLYLNQLWQVKKKFLAFDQAQYSLLSKNTDVNSSNP
jgi:hypothetical protein